MARDVCASLCDRGFFSTTSDLATASGDEFGGNIVCAIEAGQVKAGHIHLSNGAMVGWASQHPGKSEVIFPSGAALTPIPILDREKAFPKHQAAGLTQDVYLFRISYPWDPVGNCPNIFQGPEAPEEIESWLARIEEAEG